MTDFDNIDSSGFSFEEEEDLGALIKQASSRSEIIEGDSSKDFGQHPDYPESKREQETYAQFEAEPTPKEQQPEPKQEPHLETPESHIEPVQEEYHAPQAPVSPSPAPVQAYQEEQSSYTPPKPRHGQQALDTHSVGQVIRIVDAYRALDSEEADVAVQLIIGPEAEARNTSLEEVVLGVLNVNPMLVETTAALKAAKDLDPVERAFYVMELDDRVLDDLGGLTMAFSGHTIPALRTVRRTQFARELVKAIDVIEPRDLRTIEATESVLAALEGR